MKLASFRRAAFIASCSQALSSAGALSSPSLSCVQFGFTMATAMYEWIRASWKQNYARKDGSIVTTDPKLTPVSELQFTNALITETTIRHSTPRRRILRSSP